MTHKHKIGVLIYDNVQPMDFIGPWEVFSIWQAILKPPLELYLISEEGGGVHCDDHITIKAHYSFANTPQLDYLVVPGGRGRLQQVHNPVLIHFIQQQFPGLKILLSVCTGSFLVQKANVLQSPNMTTYWRALPELKRLADVHVVEQRVVKNANVWFAGGISSGIDLAFELIAQIAGKDEAGKVQLLFEYFPEDTVYAAPAMTQELPLYNDKDRAVLPAYIADYIRTKK